MKKRNPEYVWFDGHRFNRDKKTGYCLSSRKIKDGKRVRLHRYVWEFYHGEIPDGYDIHHIDGNRENNDISNLTIMVSLTHKRKHLKEAIHSPKWLAVWPSIRQKGSDAHKRPEMRLKQSIRSKEQWADRKANVPPSVVICEICGGERETYYPDRTQYCSKKCKAVGFRRKYKEENGYGYHVNYPKKAKVSSG